MVGSSPRDIEAGVRAGMATVMITGYISNSAEDALAGSRRGLSAPSLSDLVRQHFCLVRTTDSLFNIVVHDVCWVCD